MKVNRRSKRKGKVDRQGKLENMNKIEHELLIHIKLKLKTMTNVGHIEVLLNVLFKMVTKSVVFYPEYSNSFSISVISRTGTGYDII